MATKTKDEARAYELGEVNELSVIAADIIYEGAAVGDNASGYARPLVAGDPFRGFAERKADNSAGAAGDKKVRVKTRGRVKLPISGLAITDVGKDVYASDDDTFTLTKGSNTRIGSVYRHESAGVGIVEFAAAVGAEAEVTDNSAGTADGTVDDVSTAVTGVDGTGSNAASKADVDTRLTAIDENFAEVATKVNYLLRKMGS